MALFGGGPGEWIGQMNQTIADAITDGTFEVGDLETALQFARDLPDPYPRFGSQPHGNGP